ncbi:Tn3 family transposase [Saccharopolyspora soli]|uniref:Tn3 family transposase n=1 Tax=Saccharopolyspora soli TaxID=2926618 RepID=UPI0035567091
MDPNADYGTFATAARGRIDLDRVRRNWDDILRVTASIHTGAVRAHDVMGQTPPGSHRSCATTSTCSAAIRSSLRSWPAGCAPCATRRPRTRSRSTRSRSLHSAARPLRVRQHC